MDANENNLLTYKNKLTGTEFQQPVYGSQEITDCQDKRMLGDEFTTAMKIEMDATIVPNSAFEGMTDDIPWTNGEMIITGSKQWKK